MPKRSIVGVAFEIIHSKKLWRYYGKEGSEAVIEAVERICYTGISIHYFQWLKSRYMAQRLLGLPLDRLIKFSPADRIKLKGLRSQLREPKS